jgi:hypothetical protein
VRTRKLPQSQKDAADSKKYDHCCKTHAGECWYKPGSEKRNRAQRKAWKVAAKLSQEENGEDAGYEVEEINDNYSCVSLLPPASRIPLTCTFFHANQA